MVLPIKVFILGSCVSRDPFEISDKGDFDVVGYYARSSFASLGSVPFVDEKILTGIESNWQRRMVRADMDKSIFSILKKTDFDVLLIDLIDERFSLSVNKSSVHTISTEYKKALYKPNSYSLIKSGSEEKLKLWRKGLDNIARYFIEYNLDEKIIINQVYWSLRCENPEKLLDRYSKEQVELANKQLEWMYEEIKKTLPKAKFITYSDEELEIDEQHKWGVDPFHYTEKVYNRMLESLSKSQKIMELHSQDSPPLTLYKKESINELKGINSKDVDRVFKIIDSCSKLDPLSFFYQSHENGCIELRDGKENLICTRSFTIFQTNYLCFTNKKNEIAIILEQRHLNISAIYFKELSFVYKFDAAPFPFDKVNTLCQRVSTSNDCSKNSYIGVLLSYSRPYHYFYDTLPAFKLNYDRLLNLHKKSITPVYINSADFLNLESTLCCSFDNEIKFKSEDDLNDFSLKNGFILKLGYPSQQTHGKSTHDEFRLECIGKLDEQIKKNSKNLLSGFEAIIDSSDFVFWAGVCAEKRRWKEQEKGIFLCINELKKRFSRVLVIIDGMTSPAFGELPLAKVKKEHEIYERLRLKFINEENVRFISTIGEKAINKIKISQKVDAFLTSFLTDSMYPARFGKAKGVGHGSYAFKEKHSEHIHPKTSFIKSNHKRDASIFQSTSKNWARQSYSIRSGDVLKEFTLLLDEKDWNDND